MHGSAVSTASLARMSSFIFLLAAGGSEMMAFSRARGAVSSFIPWTAELYDSGTVADTMREGVIQFARFTMRVPQQVLVLAQIA